MESIKKFFIKHTKYIDLDIDFIKKIHSGYSNENYFIELKNGRQYQIRISKGINEQRENELKALVLCGNKDFIYFNSSGDAIKQWIEGEIITDWNDDLIIAIAKKMKKLHQIVPNKLIRHNYRRRLFMDLNNKYLDAYLLLIKKYENDELVFSHNDLNANNIIQKNNIPHFIDYEYACANSPYWDIANLINEANFNSWHKRVLIHGYGDIDERKLNDYLYIQLFFSYTWAIDHPEKKMIENYRLVLRSKLIKFDLSSLSI